jgi:hypothetical protein
VADAHAAFLAQLAEAERTFDVRPGPLRCVLLLSRACDRDLEPVALRLADAGVPCVRLNADETAGADLCLEPDGRRVRLNGRLLAPTVTWVRHFAASAVPEPPGGMPGGVRAAVPDTTAIPGGPGAGAPGVARAPGVPEPPGAVFSREAWLAAAEDLAAVAAAPIRDRRLSPLAQLRLAARHGVAVPRTVLTTDPRGALDRLDCPRLVVKSAHGHFIESAPGRLTGVFPVVTDRAGLAAATHPGPPVIVQEHIAHEAELRVYWVAGHIVAFRVGKGAPDEPWTAPDRVSAEPVEPPARVVTATTRLAAAMSLSFGAFDFLMRAAEPVFLEVNPDGDWRWAERRAGTGGVTDAVVAMLVALHRRPPAAPATLLSLLAHPAPGRRPGA